MDESQGQERASARVLRVADELGLKYSPHAARKLIRARGESGAVAWMRDVAAVVAYAELVWPELTGPEGRELELPVTLGQPEASALLRAVGTIEAAKKIVDRRARAVADQLQVLLDGADRRAWDDVQADDARERDARIGAAEDEVPGSLAHRVAVTLHRAGQALGRARVNEHARRLVAICDAELERRLHETWDEDGRRSVAGADERRAVEPEVAAAVEASRDAPLTVRIGALADRHSFREVVEQALADVDTDLVTTATEPGWHPDATRRARAAERRDELYAARLAADELRRVLAREPGDWSVTVRGDRELGTVLVVRPAGVTRATLEVLDRLAAGTTDLREPGVSEVVLAPRDRTVALANLRATARPAR
jgi:hypothetical protein